MTTAPARSGVSSRSRGPETFETGLHADADFGAIDVGLAVDGGTFGVVIDAPVVGQLRVAFEVAADGITRLSSLARRNAEGLEMQVVVVDETKTRALEAELASLRQSYQAMQSHSSDAHQQLGADRDEALARIASLTAELEQERSTLAEARSQAEEALNLAKSEAEAERARVIGETEARALELKAESERLSSEAATTAELAKTDAEAELTRVTEAAAVEARRLEGELEAARTETRTEQEAGQTLLGERDQARADLERLRGELDAGSASSLAELSEARAAREASEAERAGLQTELAESTAALEAGQRALTDAQGDIERLTGELASARAAQESDLGQISRELEVTKAALGEARTAHLSEVDQRSAEVIEARSTRERLERELDDARALLDGDRSSAEQSRLAMRDVLVEKEQALSATAAERYRLVEAHAEELAAAQAREDEARASLSAAEADRGQLTNELTELRAAWEQREVSLGAELAASQAHLEAREEAFARAVEQRDGAAQERDMLREQLEQLNAQLQSFQVALEAQRQAAADAQRVATQHQTQAATLVLERDEARNVARGLHQRIAGGAGVEAIKAELAALRGALDAERQNMTGVASERDRAMLQVEALGRQLDQERSARAKAVQERDQYRDRFKVLTTSQGGSGEMPRPTITSEETKAYSAQRTTTGEIATDGRGLESPTDITLLPIDVDKKKEP